MQNATPQELFDPVVIDLADPEEYVVLTAALVRYAADRREAAASEERRVRDNRLPPSDNHADRIRRQEARAVAMLKSIDRQIAANAKVRNATN